MQVIQLGYMDGEIQILRVQQRPGVDADDLAIFVDQRATGVAAGDGGIVLDVSNTIDFTIGIGDHAIGESGGKPLRISERINNLTDFVAGIADDSGLQIGCIDFQHSNIDIFIVCQHIVHGIVLTAQGNFGGVAVFDNVIVGDDSAVRSVDKAGTQGIFITAFVIGDDFTNAVDVVIMDFCGTVNRVGEPFGVRVATDGAGEGSYTVLVAGGVGGDLAVIGVTAKGGNCFGFDRIITDGANLVFGAVLGARGILVGDPLTFGVTVCFDDFGFLFTAIAGADFLPILCTGSFFVDFPSAEVVFVSTGAE